MLAAQAIGADLAYIGTRFIATKEANAAPGNKQMLIDCEPRATSSTRRCSPAFHGNYLQTPIAAAGLDPDELPEADKSKMDFGSAATKAWRDIWGSGQGVGPIIDAPPAGELVARMVAEYAEARDELAARSGFGRQRLS